jgi:hypothetical protein
MPRTLLALALALVASACHHGSATSESGGADALADAPSAASDLAKPPLDGPIEADGPGRSLGGPCPSPELKCRRQVADGTCPPEEPAQCADGRWLCRPGTSPSVTCADAGADTSPTVGCPGGCPGGQICFIRDHLAGNQRGACAPPPAQCRPEAGVHDGGVNCDQCTGFTLCNGAYACFGATTATYTCGI